MANEFSVNIEAPSRLGFVMGGTERLNIRAASPITSGVSDYNKLKNKPTINGVTVAGDIVTADLNIVSENTTAGWGDMPTYVPKAGEICIYTDRLTYKDGEGNLLPAPDIKIGDGSVPIVDLPFVSEGFRYTLASTLDEHISSAGIHVSAEDRLKWDSKLNYTIDDEELVFTRN